MPALAPRQIQMIAERPSGKIQLDIPEMPEQVLRHVGIGTDAALLDLSPMDYLAKVEEHYGRLQEAGVAMPEHTFYISQQTRRQPGATAIVVANKIDGIDFRGGGFNDLIAANLQPHATQVGDALSNYFDWAAKQPYTLMDSSWAGQWMYGTELPRPNLGQQLLYVDFDPESLERTAPTKARWDDCLRDIETWQRIGAMTASGR